MTAAPDHAPTTQDALALFDRLPVVSVDEVRGFWRGAGFHTGHPLDGLLETWHWAGKRFDDAEHVQPLVFRSRSGRLLDVRPLGAARLLVAAALRGPWLKSPALADAAQAALPLFATRRSQARLRMLQCRGRISATIVYDALPIQDVLRRLDGGTLLGMMDMKGVRPPFFFRLFQEGT